MKAPATAMDQTAPRSSGSGTRVRFPVMSGEPEASTATYQVVK